MMGQLISNEQYLRCGPPLLDLVDAGMQGNKQCAGVHYENSNRLFGRIRTRQKGAI